MMKIAVSGASGHIGNCLVRELVNKNHEVKVLVHNFENDLKGLNVEIVRGDLLNIESLLELCSGVDVVFHAAAKIALSNRETKKVLAVNIEGTKNIIEASKSAGVKRLIHFSSTDAFETVSSDSVLDENVPLIVSRKMAYAFSKAESERIVLEAAKNGLDTLVLSPSAVIGPFDNQGSFLGNALIKIYQNKIPMLIPGGYNWVDVRDVVEAAVQSIEKGKKGEKYILSGAFYSLKELSEMVSNISGKKTPGILAPVFLARLACPFFQFKSAVLGEKPIYTCQSLRIINHAPKNISNQKARQELNYTPRNLEQTLIDTFAWYKQNKLLN
jgi:dihydroflavonol-4-reductase